MSHLSRTPSRGWRARTLVGAALCGIFLLAPASGQAQGRGLAQGVVVNVPGAGQVFDPSSVQFGDISPVVSQNVFEWLFRPTSEGPQPLLAVSAETVGNGSTVRVALRDGVVFHSGDRLTAADVAFTWERMVASKVSSRYSRSLDKVTALDDRTVEFRFKEPDVAFLPAGGFPVVSKAYFDKAGEAAFVARPVGTGPYRIAAINQGQSVELEAAERYWGERPRTAKATFRFINDDTTRVASLLAGDADVVVAVAPSQVAKLEGNERVRLVRQAPGNYTIWLQYQYANPKTPWADKRVREAMARAINSRAIIDRVLAKQGELYAGFAPHDPGYDPTLVPYAYDLARARSLMAEAGFADGFRAPLNYPVGIIAGVKETVDAVVLSLRQIKIQLEPSPLQGPQFQQFVAGASRNPDKDYLAVFAGTLAGAVEPTVALKTHFTADGPFARYFNPEVTALINTAATTPERQARGALIAKAMRIMHEDYAFIPVLTSVNVFGLRKGLDFDPSPGNYLQFELSRLSER